MFALKNHYCIREIFRALGPYYAGEVSGQTNLQRMWFSKAVDPTGVDVRFINFFDSVTKLLHTHSVGMDIL